MPALSSLIHSSRQLSFYSSSTTNLLIPHSNTFLSLLPYFSDTLKPCTHIYPMHTKPQALGVDSGARGADLPVPLYCYRASIMCRIITIQSHVWDQGARKRPQISRNHVCVVAVMVEVGISLTMSYGTK